jgi:hypothetical protein
MMHRAVRKCKARHGQDTDDAAATASLTPRLSSEIKETRMGRADGGLWPLATGPGRTRWAAQAIDRYQHMAMLILARAATWPEAESPFSSDVLEAQRLYETIERRVDELARPPRPDVPCAHCSPLSFLPYPPVPEEAWPVICHTYGIVGLVGACGWWGVPARTGS